MVNSVQKPKGKSQKMWLVGFFPSFLKFCYYAQNRTHGQLRGASSGKMLPFIWLGYQHSMNLTHYL